ncbi:MAG: PASTA domain-containing protein [Saprospiraceae bacterium]|nr:PASTA domain-containing protein [Saprospiraceae bacterium]
MANYIGLPLSKVKLMAAAKDYEIVITDSVHLIGKPGGYVLNQIPKTNSLVKRGRKIYLVISRYKADEIISDNLPVLYGEKYEFKIKEFESQFQLKLKIVANKYDPGPSGHILEARYKGELIADENSRKLGIVLSKGDTIEVILSVSHGGEIDIPNLRCKTLAEAKFEIEASGIKVGNITQDGNIENLDDAYIISQKPTYEKSKKLKMESTIDVTISQTYPDDCDPR